MGYFEKIRALRFISGVVDQSLVVWRLRCKPSRRKKLTCLFITKYKRTVVRAFNGHFYIQAKVSLHGRCPLIGGTGMLEWRAEIRRVRYSHVCHQGASNQQRSPPAAPSPRTLSKPQCACSNVLYGNMQFIELIKRVNYNQRVLFLNVTPCLIFNLIKYMYVYRYGTMMTMY